MWPKVIAQLFELLPHITRLVPMADKYFSTKTSAEKANEAAFAAMAEGVRGDLGQVTKAHAGLYRQLQEQSAQIAEISHDLKASLLTKDQTQNRLDAVEQEVKALGVWIKAGVSFLLILSIAAIVLLVQILHVH